MHSGRARVGIAVPKRNSARNYFASAEVGRVVSVRDVSRPLPPAFIPAANLRRDTHPLKSAGQEVVTELRSMKRRAIN
jgi:hypothetical protein